MTTETLSRFTYPPSNEWGNDDWTSSPVSTQGAFEGWDDYHPTPQLTQESGMAERLRNLKDKVVHGIGRKLLIL